MEYQMSVDRKMAGREFKKKALIEQQRLRLEDLEEKEALDNAGLMDDDSDLDSDDKDYLKAEKEDAKVNTEGKDVESSGESEDEATTAAKSLFINPLAKKAAAEESEEWSDDDLSEGGRKKKKQKISKKDSLLGKRKRKGSLDNVADFFKNGEMIEEVPLNDPGTMAAKDGYESMDSDDVAATRILARKMLRKKARNDIMDASYGRYSMHEDPSTLPTWLVEDEAKHRFCERLQPTKEEMAMEKEALKVYNARPSKKVEQAKQRKRKRLAKAMQKIKKKA
jgi:AdoMet-dependent rRNA methyltransferase SPB1